MLPAEARKSGAASRYAGKQIASRGGVFSSQESQTQLTKPGPPDEDSLAGDATNDDGSVHGSGGRAIYAVYWLAALFACYWLGAWATLRSSKPPLIGPIATQNATATNGRTKVVVHVAGKVRRPGVYALSADARVQDAVRMAGGPLPDADTNAINLAAWAEDGTRIEIPPKQKTVTLAASAPSDDFVLSPADSIEEESIAPTESDLADEVSPRSKSAVRAEKLRRETKPHATKPKKSQKAKAQKSKATTIAGMPRGETAAGKPSDNASPEFLKKNPLNINTANAAQLEALPGVGPAMAQKILDYRKQNSNFKSVDELDEVPGIGEKKLEVLRPLVTVN